MEIGELDRRVDLETSSFVTNAYGEKTYAWASYRSVWAKIVWKGGMEKDESNKMTAISNVTFYIRNLDISLSETDRILYNSEYYYIKVINQIEGRDNILEIITKEKD